MDNIDSEVIEGKDANSLEKNGQDSVDVEKIDCVSIETPTNGGLPFYVLELIEVVNTLPETIRKILEPVKRKIIHAVLIQREIAKNIQDAFAQLRSETKQLRSNLEAAKSELASLKEERNGYKKIVEALSGQTPQKMIDETEEGRL